MVDKTIYDILVATYGAAASKEFAGFDPYDVKAKRPIARLSAIRFVGFVVDRLLSFAPRVARGLLNIRPAVNPKALALFSLGSLSLYRKTREREWLERAKNCIEALIPLATETAHGRGWGYPFDWRSKTFLPAWTPSGVVTSFCADAIMSYAAATNENGYEPLVQEILGFLSGDLWRHTTSDGAVCFSYTPLDHLRVHNANLLVASTLIRGAQLVGNDSYRTLGEAAVEYSLSQQNADGSWDYFGREEHLSGRIDNYHTGFVLRSLLTINDIVMDSRITNGLRTGLGFYLDRLFFKDFLPRHNTQIRYPVDIHACADSICTLGRFSGWQKEAGEKLERLVQWTLDHLYDGRGGFHYQYYPWFTSKIPFMRWNNAWAFYAFSSYLNLREVRS